MLAIRHGMVSYAAPKKKIDKVFFCLLSVRYGVIQSKWGMLQYVDS